MAVTVPILVLVLLIPETVYGIRNKHMTSNVTQTLDTLLASDRYDKRLRPGFGGPPITISVNFFIKSIGPVSDNDESYGLDCYFRQHWYDMRLKFEKLPGLEELSMSWLFLDRVWKPDTFFINGKKSFLHRITAPNKFLRLRHDGYITYSMRLTVNAACPMYLRRFPLDAQKCPLILGSYGYSNNDLIYKWTKEAAIGLQEGVEIAQFDLVNITKQEEKTMIRGGMPYSVIRADFWLKRHTGYFMLQVYIPCCLIVVCSWISFWIDPDAVPARVYVPCGLIVLSSWVSFWIDPDDVAARVALGVTTVLSLTTMGFGGRSQMPKVSYCTALDYFVIICFTYVFSVMIEYAVVNLNDKFKKDIKRMADKQKEEAESRKKEMEALKLSSHQTPPKQKVSVKKPRSASYPTIPFMKEPGNSSLKPFFSRSMSDSDSFNTYYTTVVAHFIPAKSQSLPNLPNRDDDIGDETTTEKDSSRLDLNEEPIDVVLDVDLESSLRRNPVPPAGKGKSSLWERLKNVKISLGFWTSSNRSFLMEDLDRFLQESPEKFSKLDVQSRRNFPLAFVISLLVYLLAFTYYFSDDDPNREPI